MKHSTLARLIAGNNRTTTTQDDQPKPQERCTAYGVDTGTQTTLAGNAERTTAATVDGRHEAAGDA